MHLLESSLLSLANPEKAAILQRFFKTNPWEYGEWDKFLGITVPVLRKTVKSYASGLQFSDIEIFLKSPWHEIRMAGVMAMVIRYEATKDQKERHEIFAFYCAHTKALNNWDLVDLSSPNIFGWELLTRPDQEQRRYFNEFISSPDLWKRRVAMVGTFAFLKAGIMWPTLQLAEICLLEKESLMHKASGWMLRELGKRCSRDELLAFVDAHIDTMPRTTLRYALEHLPKEQYKQYLERGKRNIS